MKYLVKVLTLIMIIFMLWSCKSSRASWQFVMDKGGIEIGSPFYSNLSFFLPVKCNASGTKEITVKPVSTTSYPIYYTNGKAIVNGHNIEIELYYSLKEKGKDIDRIKLPHIEPGEYKVFYRDVMNSKIFIDKVYF